MIMKRFVAKDVSFVVSFVSYDSLRFFEQYTGLKGFSHGDR